MADVKAVRDRVVTRIRAAVTGINVMDFMVLNPVLPAALVAPPPGTFLTEVTGDGCEDMELVVTVLVSNTISQNAQNRLDEYLSEGATQNLANAIESSSTANWDYAIVGAARNYGSFVFGSGDQAQTFLGFELPITVGVS
jgi:hypothetical protein